MGSNYNGKIHEPYYLEIAWGKDTALRGRLVSLNVSYTFFKPDGTPLRAKVKLAFISSTDPEVAAKIQNKSSPDMTHLVDVVVGDSLPLLSHRIYNSSSYCVQLARFNNLNKFRKLTPGNDLVFPPLIKEA